MADLEINFKTNPEVQLRLSEKGHTLDTLSVWPVDPGLVDNDGVDFHFDTMLVTSIDKILKKNRIDSLSLGRVLVGGNPDQTSVMFHVAQATAEALKIK